MMRTGVILDRATVCTNNSYKNFRLKGLSWLAYIQNISHVVK